MDVKPPTRGDRTPTPVTEDTTITGTYQGRGAECPQFRLDTGEVVSLSGAIPRDLTLGQSLTFTGLWPEFSKCQQGREFRVQEIISE